VLCLGPFGCSDRAVVAILLRGNGLWFLMHFPPSKVAIFIIAHFLTSSLVLIFCCVTYSNPNLMRLLFYSAMLPNAGRFWVPNAAARSRALIFYCVDCAVPEQPDMYLIYLSKPTREVKSVLRPVLKTTSITSSPSVRSRYAECQSQLTINGRPTSVAHQSRDLDRHQLL
jgi:hypothetical protein